MLSMWSAAIRVPGSVLVCQVHERNRNLQEIGNESAITVSESKERPDIFDFPRDRPIPYNLNLRLVHAETIWADNKA